MTDEQQILQKIFTITAGGLEGKASRERPPVSHLKSLSWLRITRLSSFWKPEKTNEQPIPLDTYISDFVSGLHGIGSSWAFLLLGQLDSIECWVGADANLLGQVGLRQCLRGALPDVRFAGSANGQLDSSPEFSRFTALSAGVAFSGTPTLKRNQETREARSDQIEKVCRSLYGSPWAYLVLAEKYDPAKVIQDINSITLEIRNIHATYKLKQSAVDENNKTADRYLELLQKRLERWEKGRVIGMWNFKGWLLTSDRTAMLRGAAILQSAFAGKDSLPDPFRIHPVHEKAQEPSISCAPLNSAEMACLASPPLEEYSGIEVVPSVRFGVETNQNFRSSDQLVRIGAILDRGESVGRDLFIKRPDLTKHGIIVGVTGAGKTNTCFALLEQVWQEGKGVPFMVIESAKSEYRALLKNPKFQGLRVFSVGDETISPIRLNPFQVPKGILIQSHIDYLQALFGAAFVLYPPMPYVLAMSIQRVYEDRGWDLTRNVNTRGEDSASCFPTLDDLIVTVRKVSDGMGYEGEIRSNIKAGLEGRLNQLRIGGGKGIMLNCRESLPDEDLFKSPCILELKQLVSDEEKAFLIGLLLIRLYEFYESKGHSGDGTLKHVTLIEEAHRLLKNVSTSQGGDSANPQGKAIEVFANLLAEIRAFGEGIFMAEQIPTKLAPEALKNTNLKLIQRLVAKDDREAVGATMNLSESQLVALTTLRPGQAVTYLEGMEKPVLLQIPETETKKKYEQISPDEIREKMAPFWKERSQLLRPNRACEDCSCDLGMGGCGRRITPKDEKELSGAALHLLRTLRWNPSAFSTIQKDFESTFSRVQPYGQNNGSPYCFWVSFLALEVSQRAEALELPHQESDSLLAVTSALLAPNLNDRQKKVESACEVWRNCHTKNSIHRPFKECVHCHSPCEFRVDVAEFLVEDKLNTLLKDFNDAQAIVKSLKGMAKDCLGIGTPHDQIAAWAYCGAVHAAQKVDEIESMKNSHMEEIENALSLTNPEA